ncbi:MAG: hypothetical protein FJZ58_07710 [Chlamydiae bacterium]|nr:hypothetical protein [Chlamydiota bacterium]
MHKWIVALLGGVVLCWQGAALASSQGEGALVAELTSEEKDDIIKLEAYKKMSPDEQKAYLLEQEKKKEDAGS